MKVLSAACVCPTVPDRDESPCHTQTFRIVPLKDLRSLTMTWAIPRGIRKLYKEKPLSCVRPVALAAPVLWC
jgi:hypothetical protein